MLRFIKRDVYWNGIRIGSIEPMLTRGPDKWGFLPAEHSDAPDGLRVHFYLPTIREIKSRLGRKAQQLSGQL